MLIKNGAELRCVGVQQGRSRGHVDGLSSLSDSQLEIDAGNLIQHQHDPSVDRGLEAWRSDRQLICPDGQARYLENTGTVCLHGVCGLSFSIPRSNVGTDDAPASGIQDAAGDSGSHFLAPSGRMSWLNC